MKDLWSDLARRSREAVDKNEETMPFGFDDGVLARVSAAGRPRVSSIESWFPVLRPALGLAFTTALLCVLTASRSEQAVPSNMLAQTEALLQSAMLNE
jgi:hypothetical protein